MTRHCSLAASVSGAIAAIAALALLPATAAEEKWIEFHNLQSFAMNGAGWETARSVALDPAQPKRLAFTAGQSIFVNGKKGSAPNLVTTRQFGDLEAHVEFLIAKGSNSGVKFHGHYEIQILDSFGKEKVTANDCGGIYPRAELLPRYHHIDKGIAPRVNAARPAGEWQSLDAIFHAPRFGADGKKIACARLVRAELNGLLIHEKVEFKTPTGHAWRNTEMAAGPLLLQGDHGPVAFRNVRVRPLATAAKP